LIPLIGLGVLLVVNGGATEALRESGIKVGFVGADLSKIQPGHAPGYNRCTWGRKWGQAAFPGRLVEFRRRGHPRGAACEASCLRP
jgi:hypothetical protein